MNNNSIAALLVTIAHLLRFAEMLDELIDVREATAYDPRYGIPNAVAALRLLEELGERADLTTARCMVTAAQRRIDAAAEQAGVRRYHKVPAAA